MSGNYCYGGPRYEGNQECGNNHGGSTFILIVVLFILLIIVGSTFC